MKNKSVVAFALFITALLPAAHAREDVEGSKDHLLIGRYPGTHITQYAHRDYDEYGFALGLNSREKEKVELKNLEGEVTTIIYNLPDIKKSTFQVTRSFEKALKNSGFDIKLSCFSEECGYFYLSNMMEGQSAWRKQSYSGLKNWFNYTDHDYRFLAAELVEKGKKYYLMLTVAKERYESAEGNSIDIVVDVLEIKDFKVEELEVVTPDSLQASIDSSGKAALDGIYFDHDKTTITPASSEALRAIASYLKAATDKKFFVVGHTDISGSYEHNLTLSQGRAESVITALEKQYRIDKSRLKSVGIGPVSPAGSNATEKGRSKNRRVELVLLVD